MALEGEHCVVAYHAAPIIDDLDELLATRFDVDANAARAGIQRVLQQLFYDRRRALDHLAGSDLVGYIFGENVDAAHRRLRYTTLGTFTTEYTEVTEEDSIDDRGKDQRAPSALLVTIRAFSASPSLCGSN